MSRVTCDYFYLRVVELVCGGCIIKGAYPVLFSVATHLFRGIIIKIMKSFRWGTPHYVKLSALHYVKAGYRPLGHEAGFLCTSL